MPRQLGDPLPVNAHDCCARTERFLAALLVALSRTALRRLWLLVSPGTVLRWHRDLIKRRHGHASRHRRPGPPRTIASICLLVLPLAAENPSWGYRRIHGELALLATKIAPPTVGEILKTRWCRPGPGTTPP